MKFAPIFVLFLLLPVSANAEAQDKVADGKFWAVNAFLAGATVFDVESTYFALNRCEGGCREANPVMRPIIEKGRPWVYAFRGSVDVGVMYVGYHLKKRGNKFWYVAPVVVGAIYVAAGTGNVRIGLRF